MNCIGIVNIYAVFQSHVLYNRKPIMVGMAAGSSQRTGEGLDLPYREDLMDYFDAHSIRYHLAERSLTLLS